MNEEVKEILDKFKIVIRNDLDYMLRTHNCKVLLDYITNLQKENERLKVALKGTTHCYDEEEHKKLKEENESLRTALNGSEEKRKKSIEYIKSNYIDNPIEFKKDILNILNGGDEE